MSNDEGRAMLALLLEYELNPLKGDAWHTDPSDLSMLSADARADYLATLRAGHLRAVLDARRRVADATGETRDAEQCLLRMIERDLADFDAKYPHAALPQSQAEAKARLRAFLARQTGDLA